MSHDRMKTAFLNFFELSPLILIIHLFGTLLTSWISQQLFHLWFNSWWMWSTQRVYEEIRFPKANLILCPCLRLMKSQLLTCAVITSHWACLSIFHMESPWCIEIQFYQMTIITCSSWSSLPYLEKHLKVLFSRTDNLPWNLDDFIRDNMPTNFPQIMILCWLWQTCNLWHGPIWHLMLRYWKMLKPWVSQLNIHVIDIYALFSTEFKNAKIFVLCV